MSAEGMHACLHPFHPGCVCVRAGAGGTYMNVPLKMTKGSTCTAEATPFPGSCS